MSATTATLRIGQLLKGRQGSYTITQQLFPTIWLASSPSSPRPLIVKSVGNWLINNERNILKRFQEKAPSLRQLVDEIDSTSGTSAIVLQHLDSDLLKAGVDRRLSRSNVKMIAKKVLRALAVLHGNGFVHTDVKPDNILVNWGEDGQSVKEACLSDCGTTVSKDSRWAKKGDAIGAPLWRSPEATLGMRWGTATDIWSFGATLVTLLAGNNFFLFKPSDVQFGHADYKTKVLENHCRFFGPSLVPGFGVVAGTNEIVAALESTIHKVKAEDNGVSLASLPNDRLSIADKIFIQKIMKLNPADRPSAKQLLDDQWFNIE